MSGRSTWCTGEWQEHVMVRDLKRGRELGRQVTSAVLSVDLGFGVFFLSMILEAVSRIMGRRGKEGSPFSSCQADQW